MVLGRDYGPRLDRQKTRLMWLVEDLGVDKFRQLIEQYMGDSLREAVHPQVSSAVSRLCPAPCMCPATALLRYGGQGVGSPPLVGVQALTGLLTCLC